MSVVLVCFSAAPKISEEAVKKEEELDKYLETRVEGQHSEHTQTNLQTMTVWFWICNNSYFAFKYIPFLYFYLPIKANIPSPPGCEKFSMLIQSPPLPQFLIKVQGYALKNNLLSLQAQ